MIWLIAVRDTSSRRSASACMSSGRRMGNESVCVLAISLLRVTQDLFGTGDQRPLFTGAQSIQATGKRGDDRQQVFGQLLLRRLLVVRVQRGQGHSIA